MREYVVVALIVGSPRLAIVFEDELSSLRSSLTPERSAADGGSVKRQSCEDAQRQVDG